MAANASASTPAAMARAQVTSRTGDTSHPVSTEMVTLMEHDSNGPPQKDKLMARFKRKAVSAKKGVKNFVRRAIHYPQALAAQVCEKTCILTCAHVNLLPTLLCNVHREGHAMVDGKCVHVLSCSAMSVQLTVAN